MKTNDIKDKCASLLRELFSEKGYMHPITTAHMQKKWKVAKETQDIDIHQKQRIWSKIQIGLDKPKYLQRKISFYKSFSIAASIILLFSLGISLYFFTQKESSILYIVKTGVRSMHELVLSDGTRVIIGPNSEFKYPKDFSATKRDVKLVGQAFFEVAKNKKKPFTVHTSEMDVTALGTAFEIFNYADRELVETILKEGKVRVCYPSSLQNKKHEKQIILNPNQKFTYSTTTAEMKIVGIDAKASTKWQENKFLCFEKTEMRNILPRLEKWYGREIICQDENILNSLFTFKVRDESLEKILYLMSHSVKMSYVKRGDAYIIRNIEK